MCCLSQTKRTSGWWFRWHLTIQWLVTSNFSLKCFLFCNSSHPRLVIQVYNTEVHYYLLFIMYLFIYLTWKKLSYVHMFFQNHIILLIMCCWHFPKFPFPFLSLLPTAVDKDKLLSSLLSLKFGAFRYITLFINSNNFFCIWHRFYCIWCYLSHQLSFYKFLP